MTDQLKFRVHPEAREAQDYADYRDDLYVIREPDDTILRFDHEGRWFMASLDGSSYRLGLDGRIRVRPRSSRVGKFTGASAWLDGEAADGLHRRIIDLATAAHKKLINGEKFLLHDVPPEPIEEVHRRIETWTPDRHREYSRRFSEIYGSVPVLPPDQYHSLYLQLVVGCPYNQCTFCTLYRDRPFRVRSPEEWRTHLEDVRDFFGKSLSLRHNIFLGDANALAVDQQSLVKLLIELRGVFPSGTGSFEQIHAFIDTFTDRERTVEEYKELKEFGLTRVYIGVETGHDPLRKLIRKPGSSSQVLQRILRIKEAGLSAGLMILTGVGGLDFCDDHLRDSVELIANCGLDGSDIVFLSPLSADETSDYTIMMEDNGIKPLSPDELAHEHARFREALHPKTKIGHYDIDGFIY